MKQKRKIGSVEEVLDGVATEGLIRKMPFK